MTLLIVMEIWQRTLALYGRAERRRTRGDTSLGTNPVKVSTTRRAKWDLLRFHLTIYDVCDEIVEWIDTGKPVKKVTMREAHAGQPGYEFLPNIKEMVFYIKVVLIDLGTIREQLLVISAHESTR